MNEITVLSRTQRILAVVKTQKVVVHSDRSVTVIDAGPIGPSGPPGSSSFVPDPSTEEDGKTLEVSNGQLVFVASHYQHEQPVASTTWVITHDLAHNPNVTVVQTDGTVLLPDVHYDSMNQITLTFSSPTSGKAYLS